MAPVEQSELGVGVPGSSDRVYAMHCTTLEPTIDWHPLVACRTNVGQLFLALSSDPARHYQSAEYNSYRNLIFRYLGYVLIPVGSSGAAHSNAK